MPHPLEAQPLPEYDPGSAFDEAFVAPGEPREHYRDLIESLTHCDLLALRASVADEVAARGMAFLTDATPHAFPLDPVPRLLAAGEWRFLARGLAQRTRALNAFLADYYGERRIVDAGRVPERVLHAAELCEPDMHEIDVPSGIYAGVCGSDVVRGSGGRFAVLEDNLRTPSGVAYAMAAREILDHELDFDPPPRREHPDAAELLRATLRAAAPPGRSDPNVVLLTDGPDNSAWWEHVELARALDVPLVTPGELEIRGARVYASTRQVDVIYRRTDEDRLRDDTGKLTWIGEALLEPLRRGNVAVVNAFGSGIADDKLVHAYVEEMIRFYLDEEPVLPSVVTYDPAEPSAREEILARIDELVVKPRDGFGGAGVVVCPHASAADRDRAARMLRTEPEAYVVQETISLSTHPTVVDGALAPRHVDLRTFTFSTPDAVAAPGGLTRVALGEGALVVNSSQNGGGKDTWVIDH